MQILLGTHKSILMNGTSFAFLIWKEDTATGLRGIIQFRIFILIEIVFVVWSDESCSHLSRFLRIHQACFKIQIYIVNNSTIPVILCLFLLISSLIMVFLTLSHDDSTLLKMTVFRWSSKDKTALILAFFPRLIVNNLLVETSILQEKRLLHVQKCLVYWRFIVHFRWLLRFSIHISPRSFGVYAWIFLVVDTYIISWLPFRGLFYYGRAYIYLFIFWLKFLGTIHVDGVSL